MVKKTRLFDFFQQVLSIIQTRLVALQSNISFGLFFLFFGFLLGNLFGTFLQSIRLIFHWDGFIVGGVLFCIELLSYIMYHRKGRSFFLIWRVPFTFRQFKFWRSVNYLKIGLLLGFFIDAFKVGS